MRVIAFASQKGGSGKTTLAGHVAVEAERGGAGPVAIIDMDPQGSLSDWWHARPVASPHLAQTVVSRLAEDVRKMRDLGIGLVIFDTPPAITATIEQVVRVSDLVVIPTRPSPHDLRAAGATVDLVETHGKPLVFVINGASPPSSLTAEAAIALSQHGTVAPVTIHHRDEFAASMIDGRTVMEIPDAADSAGEVVDLWDYLNERLARVSRAEDAVDPAMPDPARAAQGGYAGAAKESA